MKHSLISALIVIVVMALAGGADVYAQPQKQPEGQPPPHPKNSAGQNQAKLKDCIPAGHRTPDKSSCCSNLAMIFVAYYDPKKSCEELSENSTRDGTIHYICSACGNKNCEPWENRCNCPKDCPYP